MGFLVLFVVNLNGQSVDTLDVPRFTDRFEWWWTPNGWLKNDDGTSPFVLKHMNGKHTRLWISNYNVNSPKFSKLAKYLTQGNIKAVCDGFYNTNGTPATMSMNIYFYNNGSEIRIGPNEVEIVKSLINSFLIENPK